MGELRVEERKTSIRDGSITLRVFGKPETQRGFNEAIRQVERVERTRLANGELTIHFNYPERCPEWQRPDELQRVFTNITRRAQQYAKDNADRLTASPQLVVINGEGGNSPRYTNHPSGQGRNRRRRRR